MVGDYLSPPLTDEQRQRFEAVTEGEYDNIVLLSGLYGDQPASIIAVVLPDPVGPATALLIKPLYVEATDEVLKHLRDPDGRPVEGLPM